MVDPMEHVMVVATAGAMEGLGVPWPGAVLVAGAGAALGGDWSDMMQMTAIFGVAYSAGSLVQYALGAMLGARILGWMPAPYRTRLDDLLGRYGQSAVFFTRPLVIGNYISAPAGAMRMPLRRFLPSTFFGVAPWALGMMAAGDMVGSTFSGAQSLAAQYLLPAAGLLVGLAGVGALWRHLRRPRARAAA